MQGKSGARNGKDEPYIEHFIQRSTSGVGGEKGYDKMTDDKPFHGRGPCVYLEARLECQRMH